MKKNNTRFFVSCVVLLLPLLLGLILWDRLPESMPIHWNAAGEVDGWSSRMTAVVWLPLLLLGVHVLCLVITQLDPRNKDQSHKVIGLLFWLCPLLSLVIGAITYIQAFGLLILGVNEIMLLFMGLIFTLLGNYLPKCRRNYTIGIKVPWALDDDDNWDATHRFAGRLWVIGGLLIMALALLPWRTLASVLMLIILAIMCLGSVLYSYLYYRKHRSI